MSDETIFIRVSRALSDTPNGILHSRKQCSVGRTLIRHLPRFLLSFFLTLYICIYPIMFPGLLQITVKVLWIHLLLLLIYLFSLSFLFFIQFLFSVFSPSVITCFHFLCQSFLLYSLSVIITLFSLFFLWAYFVIPSPLFSLFSFLLLRFFSLVSLPRALIFLFHSLGCSDSEHRWEPGLPRPPGVVPVRHIQPVPVRSRRHLLLHRPGKCSQHQAARRECSHWHSGGKMGL